MKKLIYLIVLVLILGLVLSGCLLSNVGQVPTNEQSGITYLTKGGSRLFPLYAGQDMQVGNVLVWDDGENLCVKYQLSPEAIAEGWLLTETHLAVAELLTGIPQKNGNPIPGKFPYGDDDLGGVESYQECIPFSKIGDGVVCHDKLFIAAHAVVQKCETESFTFNPELTWTRSSESNVAVFPGYGAQWTKEQGFAISLDPLAVVWDGGTINQYFTGYSSRNDISWASWICTQNQSGKSLTGTDLRRFNATFDIPAGYTVTGGTLGSVNPGYGDVIPMNDNIYIFVNEGLIFWGGTISLDQLDPTRTHFLGMERRPTEEPQDKVAFPETDGWHMDGTIPAISSSLFIEGANNLDVFAEELWTGGGMHKLGLTLQVEQTTTCETQTAWAGTAVGTLDFPGKNWATYFTYTIPCPCIESEGSLSITGIGWKSVSAEWCTCDYTYDLTATGEPVALQGWVDLSAAALANNSDWSKYFVKFAIRDDLGSIVNVVFANSWLGTWYEIQAHPWDRISLETENVSGWADNTPHAEQWYATQGGVLGYDMDGNWVGEGKGAPVYPSDQNYFFQLIADPATKKFTLQVLAMGSSAPANPPAGWPKQNMFNYATWLEIGTINVEDSFNFAEVKPCAILWASTQAGAGDTSTIEWEDMHIGAPEIW